MTPVGAPVDVRANRAAPERTSAAVGHRWHRAVVHAEVTHESAASHRRSAEPRPEADTGDAAGDVWRTLVGGVLAALDWLAVRASHVRRLGAFLAGDDVELDLLTVADAAEVLARVVARDGGLMDEHVLFGVVAVDEAVTVLHVEPLHRADDVRQDDLRVPCT